jgi:hypothetical protein
MFMKHHVLVHNVNSLAAKEIKTKSQVILIINLSAYINRLEKVCTCTFHSVTLWFVVTVSGLVGDSVSIFLVHDVAYRRRWRVCSSSGPGEGSLCNSYMSFQYSKVGLYPSVICFGFSLSLFARHSCSFVALCWVQVLLIITNWSNRLFHCCTLLVVEHVGPTEVVRVVWYRGPWHGHEQVRLLPSSTCI